METMLNKQIWCVKVISKIYVKSSLVLVIALLASCATDTVKQTPVDAFDEFVKSDTKLEVPDSVNNALLDGARKPKVDVNTQRRFDVSVNQIPALTFFVSLVSEAGVNVVAHPDIEGSISLDLKDVTVDQVLEVIRDVYGYEYQLRSGIYTIYPRKLRTQVFQINYLDVKRVGVTDTSVLIGDINSNANNQNGQNGGNNGGGHGQNSANLLSEVSSGEQSQSNNGQAFSPGTRVQTLNATDFWGFLKTSLTSMIGDDDDGRFVMINPQAGMVVVRALPVELVSVKEFLEKSELSVKRQVILETKILEVRLNEQHESGINWAAITGALQFSGSDSERESSSMLGGVSSLINEYERVTENIFSSALGISDITKLIGLLDRQGDVSVLSSPRISTVNNQKAVIRVGSDEFFVTGIANQTIASAAAVTNTPQVQLSSFFSGISLDVTPQISEDGEVILHVHPIVSDVKDQLKEFQVGDDSFSLPLALRDVRESDSIVRAASGEVVVLGGLMQESSSDVDTRRSKLGNVPILNIFFKHEAKTLQKTELVILMRPIVVGERTWEDQISRRRGQLDVFGRD